MEYKSDRNFKIWHYIVSHATLIIRSEKQYSDVNYAVKFDPNCTIDIEFSGVDFISLPHSITELTISKEKDIHRFNQNKVHYVKASSCIVGISQFDSTQDRISDSSLEYEKILMTF